MAVILRVNGQVEEIEPENGMDFTLEEAQKIVGGWVELLRIAGPLPQYDLPEKGLVMLVNEEGRLDGLPPNEQATMIFQRDFIVGDALICRSNQFQ